MVGSWFIGF